MRIELLTSPGCPHADAARRTVAEALTMLGMDVAIVERVGRFPSPTVLVDGVDAMRLDAEPATADACRLDLPTPHHVVDAIRQHRDGDPCETVSRPPGLSASGRPDDRPRSVSESAAALPPDIRDLHRAVLCGFRDHGQVHRDDLHQTAAALGFDLDAALHHLATVDLVHTAADGHIEIAYPFSRRPTGHTVHLESHPPVQAMCAIDALGIPLMTGTDGVIDSADPATGTPIHIHRHGHDWTWHPATAVVVIGHTDGCGTLADTVCRSITFHTGPDHARTYLDERPELHGLVLGQADAIALADYAFGPLLTPLPIDATADSR